MRTRRDSAHPFATGCQPPSRVMHEPIPIEETRANLTCHESGRICSDKFKTACIFFHSLDLVRRRGITSPSR